MTFGQSLKQIVAVSGIKMSQLASGLGYDSSYICRWINDAKLPSVKNNTDLFEKIAAAIMDCSSDGGVQALCNKYELGDAIELRGALASELQEAYTHSTQDSPFASYIERNASYLSEGKATFGFQKFRDAFYDAAKKSGSDLVECICATLLSRNGNSQVDFFPAVLSGIGDKISFRIMVHQLVDIDDFARNIDVCCATICTFTRYSKDVLYTFYEYDRDKYGGMPLPENYLLVEGSMLYFECHPPLSRRLNSVNCFDSAVLRNEFSYLKHDLAFLPKLLKFCSNAYAKENNQFLFDYIMGGNIRYFLDIMQPIYMTDELFRTVGERVGFSGWSANTIYEYNNICAAVPKEVVVYRSAILNYICYGEIFVFGKVHTLDRDLCVTHLEQLVENIETGKCRLTILSDVNPLLNREDTHLSFFLSRKSGFMVSSSDVTTPVIRMRSVRMIEYFNAFFSHIQALGDAHVTTGDHALDFIRRGLEISKRGIR